MTGKMREPQKWLEDEGIIYYGAWEPVYIYKQWGKARQNTASECDFIRTEEFIKAAKKRGVNQIWYPFFKGYGLKFEYEDQQKTRKAVKLCQKYGIRTVAYCTFGSIVYESLKDEGQDVESWMCEPESGLPASYGQDHQCFRVRPCYSSEGYVGYMKEIVSRAIGYGFDAIHFDNTNTLPEPGGCKCKRCVDLWHVYLDKKFGKGSKESIKAGQERFGTNNFQNALAPWFDIWNTGAMQREVKVAYQQEWALFRQEVFAKAMLALADFIHKKGKAVEYNMGKSPSSDYRLHGSINEEVIYPAADIIFNEGAGKTQYNAHGAPVTRIRAHKIAQNFDVPMMFYNRTISDMAEAFSFNPGMLALSGTDMFDKTAENEKRYKYFQYYHKYKHYQTKQHSLAQVAFLHHNKSMTFSVLDTYLELVCMQQLFQEEKIPFNIVYSKDLDALEQYKLLCIPAMHCLSEEEGAKIKKWVKAGGALLISGKTGTMDDYFQLRTKVKEIKSIEDYTSKYETENLFTDLTGEDFTSGFMKNTGKGKCAYIKELQYLAVPDKGPATWMVAPDYYNVPKNKKEILKAIDFLLPERELLVATKEDLLVDLCVRNDTGEGLVHLFNMSYLKGKKGSTKVSFKWAKEVKTLTRIGYNMEETPVKFKKDGKRTSFDVANIEESAVIIVNKK